jgi:hypothetical protein
MSIKSEELSDLSLDEFCDWMRENNPKWTKIKDTGYKRSNKEILERMLLTCDGLGSKLKKKALDLIINDRENWRDDADSREQKELEQEGT